MRQHPDMAVLLDNNNNDNDLDILHGLNERLDANDNSRPLCNSRQTIIYPKKAQTVDNRWMYIVNVRHYVQGVLIELCETNDGVCAWPARQQPMGRRPVCRQRFMNRQLLAIDGGSRRPVMGTFRMPCCCVCVLEDRWDDGWEYAFGW